MSALYRIDIIKDGRRWNDPVGVTATSATIAAVAIALVSEAAVEIAPAPGCHCVAEVFDDQDRFVLKAELSVSG